MRFKATVELLVAAGGIVLSMESAYPVEILTTGFAQCISKGKTNAEPFLVAIGDVELSEFNLLNHFLNVGFYHINMRFKNFRIFIKVQILIPGKETKACDIFAGWING